jgi:hypothetical protein
MKNHSLAITSIVATIGLFAWPQKPTLAAHGKHRDISGAMPRSQINQVRSVGKIGESYGVDVDGHEIGRDPDPNVRQELRNEYYVLQGPS